jgi:hypothetical protein
VLGGYFSVIVVTSGVNIEFFAISGVAGGRGVNDQVKKD